jgi:hypothetical protein
MNKPMILWQLGEATTLDLTVKSTVSGLQQTLPDQTASQTPPPTPEVKST